MGGKYEIKPTDLNELVKKTSTIFGRTKKDVAIHRRLNDDLWTVEVDRGQIEQALLNLYVNAWQAMPGGGNLYLETKNLIMDENFSKSFELKAGRYVKLSVVDTGIGMDEKTKERIFEPFFTTKQMGRGTGLGLASVYGIIKNHKGAINVYSEKGHGATFNIYLPASEKEAVKEKSLSAKVHRGHETILLVDDEKIIIDVTQRLLKKLGYKVLIAENGKMALQLYEKHKDEINLVILDMTMPEMSGKDTFLSLKAIDPKVKVVLSSGYSLNQQVTEVMEQGCLAFIQKPFDIVDLSDKLGKIFGHP
jgi:two-component system cell cycle sensor histidine kinase/response regulator CckA